MSYISSIGGLRAPTQHGSARLASTAQAGLTRVKPLIL